MLQLVKNPAKRKSLHGNLVRILKSEMRPAGTWPVGFQGGNIPLAIHTMGEGRLWAAFSKVENRPAAGFFDPFGIFDGTRASLDISVEINIAFDATANVAGMVAVDDRTDRAFLLHTGRVAGGYPGVGMRAFLARSTWSRSRLAEVYDGRRLIREGVLIGDLSPGISARIEEYVNEVAAFKRWVRGNAGDISSIAQEIDEFSRYKKEFAGRCRRKEMLPGEVEVEHGGIVDALHRERCRIAGRGESVFNTPIIDLYVKRGLKWTEVYEVKTSTDRQSLYTAIGQLIVHAHSAGEPKLSLVTPDGHIAGHIAGAAEAMDIRMIRYERSGDGYVFTPSLRGR